MWSELVDDGPTGIAKAEELSDFVVGFSRGVIARAAFEVVFALGEAGEEMRVAAAGDEGQHRVFGQAGIEEGRFDVAVKMVDSDQRNAVSEAESLRVGKADEQAADQARALRGGDGVEVLIVEAGHGFADHGDDGAQVFAASQFRHDAAILRMDVQLGSYAGRKNSFAVFRSNFQNGRGRFVAGRLNAQDPQTFMVYSYDLPPELIAKHPLAERSASRLLVVHRKSGKLEDRQFTDLPEYFEAGDCLVLNNTKVIPARLYGQRPGLPGKIEILLVRRLGETGLRWEALVRPGRKLPVDARVILSERLEARIVAAHEGGLREVELLGEDVEAELERVGHVPLPPYLQRPDEVEDRQRYQTVFAKYAGSSAAPTAGPHFTPEILVRCPSRAEVTLHVGLGTFQPLTEEHLRTGKLHSEYYEVGAEAAATINAARRVICVGTTSVRTVESAALRGLPLQEQSGDTQLFIRPGFEFRVTGAMVTNFHLPESSLLMLVSAFAGYELTMEAYRHAVRERYRFFSYGDAMLIL